MFGLRLVLALGKKQVFLRWEEEYSAESLSASCISDYNLPK
jgi:hypothetical protein